MAHAAAIVGAALTVGGTLLSAKGMRDAGAAERTAGERTRVAREFEAAQLRQQAGQELAASQRQALEERRKADLVASRAIALAAASGGGVSDPTIVRLLARQKGEGAYRAGVALYEGEERARKLELGADTKDYEGAVAAEAGILKEGAYKTLAKAQLLKGAGSLFARYGAGGPGAGGGSGDSSILDAGSGDVYNTGMA